MNRPLAGWLNIYKPKGISSAKVVSTIKKILNGTKTGHTGTLDLEAEGVLPLALGEATKLTNILVDARKKYIFTIKFGAQTDTGDHAGKIIKTTDYIPPENKIYDICTKFTGIIEQVPPAFSALKINGVRAYKLARENQSVKLAPRKITIYNLECLNFDQEKQTATYLAECSKGTYIRTLTEDIALSLQSLGFVIELRRTQVGQFKEEDSLITTDLEKLDQGDLKKLLETRILRIETVLDDILVLDATLEQAQKIRFGQKCHFDCNQNINSVWIRHQGVLLAIGSVSDNCFNSSRVFNLT